MFGTAWHAFKYWFALKFMAVCVRECECERRVCMVALVAVVVVVFVVVVIVISPVLLCAYCIYCVLGLVYADAHHEIYWKIIWLLLPSLAARLLNVSNKMDFFIVSCLCVLVCLFFHFSLVEIILPVPLKRFHTKDI